MAQQLIQCPKDPQIKYQKKVCETIFRKDNFRTWCKKCQNFQPSESPSENT